MPPTLNIVLVVVRLVVMAAGVCVASDRFARRRRLHRLRTALCSQRDVSDEEFSAAIPEIESQQLLEMRRMLAALLGIDARKIRPDWRFCEERDVRGMEPFIFSAFAGTYAPEQLRDRRSFAFPAKQVATIRELFLETVKLQGGGPAVCGGTGA